MGQYRVAVRNEQTGEAIMVEVHAPGVAGAQVEALHRAFYELGWRQSCAGIPSDESQAAKSPGNSVTFSR